MHRQKLLILALDSCFLHSIFFLNPNKCKPAPNFKTPYEWNVITNYYNACMKIDKPLDISYQLNLRREWIPYLFWQLEEIGRKSFKVHGDENVVIEMRKPNSVSKSTCKVFPWMNVKREGQIERRSTQPEFSSSASMKRTNENKMGWL